MSAPTIVAESIDSVSLSAGGLVCAVTLALLVFYVLYQVIRIAVKHGVNDAWRQRAEFESSASTTGYQGDSAAGHSATDADDVGGTA